MMTNNVLQPARLLQDVNVQGISTGNGGGAVGDSNVSSCKQRQLLSFHLTMCLILLSCGQGTSNITCKLFQS
eukprot:199985-Karenia_brevis.AAC.1